jgi:hypothetical protein
MAQYPGKITMGDMVAGIRGDLVATELDDETVMMSIERGKFYGLDPVAGRIWALVREPQKVSTLVEGLLEEFDGERAVVERDLLAFLNALAREGMLAVEAAPAR